MKWDLSIPQISIYDKKMDVSLTIVKNEGLCYSVLGNDYWFDLEDIHHVVVEEPKLLKEGTIAFYVTEDDMLAIRDEENEDLDGLNVVIGVQRKFKDEFYLIFSILNDNGIDITVI